MRLQVFIQSLKLLFALMKQVAMLFKMSQLLQVSMHSTTSIKGRNVRQKESLKTFTLQIGYFGSTTM